jgi:hypothetical protein
VFEISSFRIAERGTWTAEKGIVMTKKYKWDLHLAKNKECLDYQRLLVSRLV